MKPNMDIEFEKYLVENYPKIFAGCNRPPEQSNMRFGCECGNGWFDLIDTLCLTIQNHIDHAKEVPQAVAAQVKEKYGGLRFYIYGGDSYVYGLIRMAETISYRICEQCGNKGSSNNSGWISTLCEECRS